MIALYLLFDPFRGQAFDFYFLAFLPYVVLVCILIIALFRYGLITNEEVKDTKLCAVVFVAIFIILFYGVISSMNYSEERDKCDANNFEKEATWENYRIDNWNHLLYFCCQQECWGRRCFPQHANCVVENKKFRLYCDFTNMTKAEIGCVVLND